MMDFGCNLGRLAVFWVKFFDNVTCVDQSFYHLQTAMKETARFAPVRSTRVKYLYSDLNLQDRVQGQKFDFISSFLTLQHIASPMIVIYLEQFCDVLKIGGYAFFQIPIETTSPNVWNCDESEAENGGIKMYSVAPEEVNRHMTSRGCELVDFWEGDKTGFGDGNWIYKKVQDVQ
jgi:SAM-dependent methyltransferase